MNEDNNNSSVLIENKQTIMPIQEHSNALTTSSGNIAESSTRPRNQTTTARKEGGVQTRQLKEAGASTSSDRVFLRSFSAQEQKVGIVGQTNKFKPANHGSAEEKSMNATKLLKELEPLLSTSDNGVSKPAGIAKAHSFGSIPSQGRDKGLKNSSKEGMDTESGKKGGTSLVNLTAEDEMLIKNGTHSSEAFTACTGDETLAKQKSEDKSNQKISPKRNKDDQSSEESSSKSGEEGKDSAQSKKLSNKEKEKLCMKLIKEINRLEAQSNMEASNSHMDDDMPKFCSNKSCPISEHKVPKTPKIQSMAKKVILRKVLFQEHDERWYCIKCLKAHNESLFCFYCGQIYFDGADDFEDDGKAWIKCDDCDKWIHLDCDILKGKNMELKKHYNDDNYHYSCPECRHEEKPRKRDRKELGKRKPSIRKQDSKQSFKRRCTEKNSSVYSNSGENESQNHKSAGHQQDSQLANGDAKMDDELVDNSYYSHTENEKRHTSEKGNRYKYVVNHFREDSTLSDLEDFTKERSIRFARENTYMIESRTLGPSVLQFCGFSPTQVQERIQQEIDTILSAITMERSESDEYSSSPRKGSEAGDRNCRGARGVGNLSNRNAMNGSRNGTESKYSRRLRTRKSRNPVMTKF